MTETIFLASGGKSLKFYLYRESTWTLYVNMLQFIATRSNYVFPLPTNFRSLQMQQHNEIVGEFSRRLFKEFKQTGLTEEEMLKKAEEAIRTKEEGNKAREAAVGGAHMIKVAKETIFDVACVGAGTLDCNDYDPNYRYTEYTYTTILILRTGEGNDKLLMNFYIV